MTNSEILNDFFVRIFNRVLAHEENILSQSQFNDLSVSEIHIIEAAAKAAGKSKNTMTNIANYLSMTPGALSISVNTLVKKGYLSRATTESDRRKVIINLTPKAAKAEIYHRNFHESMISSITDALTTEEISALSLSLARLMDFFDKI